MNRREQIVARQKRQCSEKRRGGQCRVPVLARTVDRSPLSEKREPSADGPPNRHSTGGFRAAGDGGAVSQARSRRRELDTASCGSAGPGTKTVPIPEEYCADPPT